MQWRRLINEAEVEAALVSVGFETVYLERMNAAEQVSTFENAEWIVAPVGSALLNMIFADPAAKVLILSQPNLFNWGTLQGPMEALGYKPLFVCGERANDENYKHSDYRMSPGLVMSALRGMGFKAP
jgi:capsular polysaccharide biosynthesis protein